MKRNEFGVPIDSNGYAPSLLMPDTEYPMCYGCLQTGKRLERHEIFPASNRQKSKRYGLWVCVCRQCHEKMQSAQGTKASAQDAAMRRYGWSKDDFIRIFGANYKED